MANTFWVSRDKSWSNRDPCIYVHAEKPESYGEHGETLYRRHNSFVATMFNDVATKMFGVELLRPGECKRVRFSAEVVDG